jgi:chromosome segregation ATPase
MSAVIDIEGAVAEQRREAWAEYRSLVTATEPPKGLAAKLVKLAGTLGIPAGIVSGHLKAVERQREAERLAQEVSTATAAYERATQVYAIERPKILKQIADLEVRRKQLEAERDEAMYGLNRLRETLNDAERSAQVFAYLFDATAPVPFLAEDRERLEAEIESLQRQGDASGCDKIDAIRQTLSHTENQ